MHLLQSEAEIKAIVNGFESCTTEKTQFKHQDHLVVVVTYLNEFSVQETVERMRLSLMRFIAHHQIDKRKYNETITVFWVEAVSKAIERMPDSLTLLEMCNRVIQEFPNGGLALNYYSKELLYSDEARETFVKPDLAVW